MSSEIMDVGKLAIAEGTSKWLQIDGNGLLLRLFFDGNLTYSRVDRFWRVVDDVGNYSVRPVDFHLSADIKRFGHVSNIIQCGQFVAQRDIYTFELAPKYGDKMNAQ